MARMLTDVMEREAYEDALDPLPEDDLPVVDVDDRDAVDPFDDGDATFDADGKPLPDEVQAEIEALAAEGLDVDPDSTVSTGETREDGEDAMEEADEDLDPAALDPAALDPAVLDRTRALERTLEATRRELARQREIAGAAVARYREAVLAAEPDLPPEMVRGERIEEVDASIVAARTMVAKVRERVESRRPSERGFPAGAPARDTSGRGHLTARQKIAAGLQERLM